MPSRLTSLTSLVCAAALAACASSSSSSPTDGGHDASAREGSMTTPSETGPDATDAGETSSVDAGVNPCAPVGDAAPTPIEAGTPIPAPDDTWTWIDFPDALCASGTPTGIGINPHSLSTKLVIFMEGGGACTNAEDCWGPSPTATNKGGYDSTNFGTGPANDSHPLLDRTNAQNPMAEMNYVFVPYCTGDLHGGTQQAQLAYDGGSKTTDFYGARDMDIFLARILPTFPGTTRVYLAGASAGGFGTFISFDRVANAFGVRVDIIDDSGPPISVSDAGAAPSVTDFALWGNVAPARCSLECCTSLRGIYDFDRVAQPGSRYGLMSFAEDVTISCRFGYTAATFPPVLDAFTASIAGDDNAHTLLVTGYVGHIVESKAQFNPQLLPWVTKLVSDDPAWANETYQAPPDAGGGSSSTTCAE